MMKKKRFGGRHYLALAGATALAVVLAACGSDGPTTPQVTTPSTTIARPPVVLASDQGTFPALAGVFRPLTTTETGAFDVTVDWTFAANDIDVFLARGSCTVDQLIADQCNFAAMATSETAKPERLRVANQAAGAYTLVVLNFGPGDESISYQVVFTPGASAAAASTDVTDAGPDKGKRRIRAIVRD